MKYEIIYADPPWSYRVWSHKGRGRAAENHYETMSLEAIKALPISAIAAQNCALFLWATFPNIQEALQVLHAWGFKYSTVAFVWVKRNKKSSGWFWGLGYWTRANAEVCLLGIRGNPRRVSAAVHQVIEAPIGSHSAKPGEIRERIVQLMGDSPRIELFARDRTPGWDALGWELDGKSIAESIPEQVKLPEVSLFLNVRSPSPDTNILSQEAA